MKLFLPPPVGFIAVLPGTMHSLASRFPPANVYKGMLSTLSGQARVLYRPDDCNCVNRAAKSFRAKALSTRRWVFLEM